MKRIFPILTAAVMAVCTLSVLPQTAASAITSDEILEQQLTMPVISIDTLGNSVNTKESYTDAKITIWDENGTIDTEDANISIRLRGNSTLNLDKKSYRFKFPKKFNPLHLGDGSAKSWNLVANYYDTSLLRSMTAYHLGDMLDNMPYTPNSRSVEVYVNGSYQGVYLLCEAVNVAKSRVAITEDTTKIEEDGYLVEMSRYAEENVFTVDCCQYEVKSDVSGDPEIAAKQIAYISNYTEQALHALKSGSQSEAEKYIDIPSLVDNYLANELCKNVDAGWDSYYFSKDAGGKLTFHPMWDYDLALGNNTEAKGISDAKGLGIFDVTDSSANSNPWLCYAIRCDWFREMLQVRWDEKLAEIETLPDFVRTEASVNADSYNRNFTKWNTLGRKVYNETDEAAALKTHSEHAAYLANWLNQRIAWLNNYYHSDAFTKGVFLDENDQEIDVKNAVVASALMFWGGSGTIDTNSPGFTAEASSGWWGGQALSTGIMLQKGQTYRLSFDYTAPSTASINYRIQANHDSYTSYLNGSTSANGTTQSFEKEFTAGITDFNCAIVLEFKGSGTVNVEHLSLVALDPEPVRGDVNGDGVWDLSDVVALQKWLLAVPDAAGDFVVSRFFEFIEGMTGGLMALLFLWDYGEVLVFEISLFFDWECGIMEGN